MKMKKIDNFSQIYNSRDERNKFIFQKLNGYIGSSVLNIGGGGERFLEKYLPKNIDYKELDICGIPDIQCDLERDIPLDIDDNQFETLIATEVLEHLENPIEVMNEMSRLSNKYLILSLPNAWVMMKTKIFSSTSDSGKFYGFPIEVPTDRHKWFFSAFEAESFYMEYAKRNDLMIMELFHVGYYHKNVLKNLIRKIISIVFGERVRKNMFSTSVWCIYKKISPIEESFHVHTY